MKKSNDLINLPVISIDEGIEIGKVQSLIVDPKKREITAFAVSDNRWYKEIKVVSYALLCGIGEYAVMVENSGAVVNLSSIPEIERLLLNEAKIKDAKVITRGGKFIGNVREYFIDEKAGKILSYEIILSPSEEVVTIPQTAVVTIGRDILIVTDNVEEYFGREQEEVPQESREIISPAEKLFEEKISSMEFLEAKEGEEQKEEKVEEAQVEPAEEIAQEEVSQVPPPSEKKMPDLAELFKERKKKFVLGKIATKTILTEDGEVIVSEGEIINEDVIEKAEAAGKFTELSLNVRQG